MTLPDAAIYIIVLIVLFLFYSILGTAIEHVSYTAEQLLDPVNAPQKAWINPVMTGFPLYGLGALLIICIKKTLIDRYQLGAGVEFGVYSISLTLLELLAGIYVGAGKDSYIDGKVESWDYSNNWLNYDGKIDVYHAIAFGLLGMFVARLTPI
jgi:uncharacterized membrane protein